MQSPASSPPIKATVHIREDGARFLVSINGPAYADIKASFKSTFPQHGRSHWVASEQAWAVPGHELRRLQNWVNWQSVRRVHIVWPEEDARLAQEIETA